MKSIAQVFEKAMLGAFRSKQSKHDHESSNSLLEIAPDGNQLNKRVAEKIVNDYGLALQRASEINKSEMERLLKDLNNGKDSPDEVAKGLKQGQGRYHKLFTLKVDQSLLPYSKETIREAIELLLQYDRDPNNIRLLKEGLRYLDSFV
ncbi:MAG: hypothetical protein JRH08_15350 [Deltaproteobacteria bacterium]|nr:hypothetical protein [Deltaproteobacteria bacterium]MBW1927739.1 hypothetical protein [Deltaproteobacteria bacterium]MBW2026900.1 hypothetical protein [Deltaproteobacteria bacterium]MBW2127006.1 hypothetical protein [Deltaproteobacteria bacterium]RLC62880.1 MAG: hypothetical protein DRI01_06160 [Chloroflexota bacterium]